jgi:GNAT superfamily N-acetyltransferase
MPTSERQARPGNASAVYLQQIVGELPAGLTELRVEASAEGYRFLERLTSDWDAGALRFTKPGEVLLAAYSDGTLAGIGGLTADPVLPRTLRMRRFYIRPSLRRLGIGRGLAVALLERAVRTECPITVNAASGSEPFWESLGFVADQRDGHTHLLGSARRATMTEP